MITRECLQRAWRDRANAAPAVFIVLMLAGSLVATADTDGPYAYTVTNSTAVITNFNKSYSGALSITNKLGGFPVSAIGDYAFYDCNGLTSVAIPSGVTAIGVEAFRWCDALSSVTIPGSVATIGIEAFYGCPNLGGVAIPFGVTIISRYAFARCTGLGSVSIPASVTNIGYYVFQRCASLPAITVDPANLCYSSPDGVLFDKDRTVLIEFPAGKTGAYDIPAGVKAIGRGAGAFAYCSGLTSVSIPGSVTNIGDWSFYECANLTGAAIAPGVDTIGRWAFYKCSSLTGITIPSTVKVIGEQAFFGCTSLRPAYFFGDAPNPGASVFEGATNATVYYLPETSGWGSPYADRPAVLWNPAFAAAGFTASAISCCITGTPDIPVGVEASTNLLIGGWLRLLTTNLAGGSVDFNDPDAALYATRFYRIMGP